MVHFGRGDLAAAQAVFDSFLRFEPDSAPARFRLSLIQARRGRFLSAIALAEQALQLEPDRVETLSHLARCQLARGHLDAARTTAMRALPLAGANASVLDMLAVVLARLDEQAAAVDLFDRAVAIVPNQASLYFNRALAHRQFGSADAAVADLHSCLGSNPNHAKAHWNLASLQTTPPLASTGAGHQHALDALRLALGRKPSDADADILNLALSRRLEHQGDLDEAADALRRALAHRQQRSFHTTEQQRALVRGLIDTCDAAFVPPPPRTRTLGPVFIVGLPRSGVGLMSRVLSRHSKVHQLGTQPVFARLFSESAGRDDVDPLDVSMLASAATVDFEDLAQRYRGRVGASRQSLVCEGQPMNFQWIGWIAKTFPGARFLHVLRDPLDHCVAMLAHPHANPGIPTHQPAALAAYHRDYQGLMRHWHDVLPGSIMDVSYESLVERHDMVLRVVCSFLGLRYASTLRTGLELHRRQIGRGRRLGDRLPALARMLDLNVASA